MTLTLNTHTTIQLHYRNILSVSTNFKATSYKTSIPLITGVIQLIPPVLSSETLLHILLSSEYSGFRPSTTAVVTQTVHTQKRLVIVFEGIIYLFSARMCC